MADTAFPEGVRRFVRSWTDLLSTVAALPGEAFAVRSGCRGWSVNDLVCHLVLDAQDVLITLATPVEGIPGSGVAGLASSVGGRPTPVDAAGYWSIVPPPTGVDPLDALIPRLAAAYGDPTPLQFHLDDVGQAAARAALRADAGELVVTQDMVLPAGEFLDAYVLEWTLHHLDLLAGMPPARTAGPDSPCVSGQSTGTPPLSGPAPENLRAARTLLQRVIGEEVPASVSDGEALLLVTGRARPTARQVELLGPLSQRLPLPVG